MQTRSNDPVNLRHVGFKEGMHLQLGHGGDGFDCWGLYGAAERNRTPDLLITNQLLYQLSYCSDIAAADYTFLARLAQFTS